MSPNQRHSVIFKIHVTQHTRWKKSHCFSHKSKMNYDEAVKTVDPEYLNNHLMSYTKC